MEFLAATLGSLRTLLRRPGYSLTVAATLALGIGATTAVFALVHAIVLTDLPYRDAGQLVIVRESNPGGSWNTSIVDYQAIAAEAQSLEGAAAMRSGDALVGSGVRGGWLKARYVTANFFDLLGVQPATGRGFAVTDAANDARPVVLIGAAFAAREFAGRGDPVGQSLLIDGVSHTVAGVMPAGAESWPGMKAELWPILKLATPKRRGPFFLSTLARLKPGVSLEQARADLDTVSRQIFPLWKQGFQDEKARLTPFALKPFLLGDSAAFLWIALGAVGAVLLIALVNNANLMLMRLAQRRRDLEVRAALGASRWRLARLLVGENLLLVGTGAGFGVLLAAFLLERYRALGPALPRLAEVRIDPTVLGFAALLALGVALALALLPIALGVVGRGPAREARGSSTSRGQERLRDGLVVLEFALALPLLLSAGLLADSLARLTQVDAGFETKGVLTASVRLPQQAYPDPVAQLAFWQRALPELRALPGVRGVTVAGALPPDCGCGNNFDIVGRPAPNGNQPASPWVPVDAGFFDALGIRLLEGRGFESGDTPDSPRVLIVSSAWAKRYFPGESAVGKQVFEGGGDVPLTIVGVVGDVRYEGLAAAGETVFAPVSQGWGGNAMSLMLVSATTPLAQVTALRNTLARLDPALVPADLATMDTLLTDATGDQRHWAIVIGGFALSAVALAALGVFGVLAYHVAQRQRELGIRQALGASRRDIVGLVLHRGLRSATLGIAAGSVLAVAATRGLDALLYDVSRAEPLAWFVACAGLLAIATVASWVPARRAASVSPQVALRDE